MTLVDAGVCRLWNMVGGVKVDLQPLYRTVSNVGVAVGYVEKDLVCHLKLCAPRSALQSQ